MERPAKILIFRQILSWGVSSVHYYFQLPDSLSRLSGRTPCENSYFPLVTFLGRSICSLLFSIVVLHALRFVSRG
jgi:hypothetical protein